MKCSRCLAEIPAQSQFCLRCGASIGTTATNPTGVVQPAFFTPPNTNRRAIPIVIGLLTILVLALGAAVVHSTLVQHATNSPNTNLVQQPSQSGPSNMVQVPTESEPSRVVQTTTETAPKPTDVMDYLAWLKSIELTKQRLTREEYASLSTKKDTLPVDMLQKMLQESDNPDASTTDTARHANVTVSDLTKETNKIADQWNQLTMQFTQRTAPESCRELHDKYYDQLGKIQAAIIQVYTILGKVQSDPQAALRDAHALQGSASEGPDAAIRAADEALSAVCRKYSLQKDFDIKDPVGPSNIFQFGM